MRAKSEMVYSLLRRRLIGDGRLAGQLAVAHGEAVLKRHLFADGQRGRGELLDADALVADEMLRSSMLPVLESVYSTLTFCPLRALLGVTVYVAVICGAAVSV